MVVVAQRTLARGPIIPSLAMQLSARPQSSEAGNYYKRRRRRLQTFSLQLLVLFDMLIQRSASFLTAPCFFRPSSLLYRADLVRCRYAEDENAPPAKPPDTIEAEESLPSLNATVTARKSTWFQPDQLNSIKQSVDIADVVEAYRLPGFERRPSGAKAVCPFHNDHNPSLSIDSSRQLYKCFSCGAGGDVFHFVRSYSRLEGPELTFFQAVRKVAEEFGHGSSDLPSISSQPAAPVMTPEQREAFQQRKERILLANAAAAAFYLSALTEPIAGSARGYLMQRGLTPETVREFAIGYALDAYYGPDRTKGKWGEGSLVEHLTGLGFTPREIVDAGLATQAKGTTRSPAPLEAHNGSITTENPSIVVEEIEVSSLMDRFRGRLVVPILDGNGKKVLGFGGRILPGTTAGDFEPPKYLNSPESSVFHKKDVLFGEHMARKALKAKPDGDLVVVEGYMDAISLWTVGIKSVVATMGTALSKEQLSLAARVVRLYGDGRVVLCMDSDQAGILAVERICNNGLLRGVSEDMDIVFNVARLPEDTKDPAEFIEQVDAGGSSARERFNGEVLSRAKPWAEWYIDRILESFDPAVTTGGVRSFSGIFERIAEFMAEAMPEDERTQIAGEVAGCLSKLMASISNETQVSKTVRSQLEGDLLDLASRLAVTKEAVQRRTESVSGATTKTGLKSIMSSLARGEGPSGVEDDEFKGGGAPLNIRDGQPPVMKDEDDNALVAPVNRRRRFRKGRTGTKSEKPPLTPHFSGFLFEHKTDADWLGVSWKQGTPSSMLGYSPDSLDDGSYSLLSPELRRLARRRNSQRKVIYFNSNEYHGQQFLTEDARNAGYEAGSMRPDASFIERGVASLLKQDTARVLLYAEMDLLKFLVRHRLARVTIKNVMDARKAIGSSFEIDWSSDAHAWLFDRLVAKGSEIPTPDQQVQELRSFLSNLPDCPVGAFQLKEEQTSTANVTCEAEPDSQAPEPPRQLGMLDRIFVEEDDQAVARTDQAIAREPIRCEIVARQLFTTVLWISTTRRLDSMQQEWLAVSLMLGYGQVNATLTHAPERLLAESLDNETQVPSSDKSLSEEERSALESEFESLAIAVRDTSRNLQSLAESSRRLGSRVIDESASISLEGRLSASLQADLASNLDDFVANYKNPVWSDRLARIAVDRSNEEPYEDMLERIDREWGEWSDDDYVWTCPTSTVPRLNRAPVVLEQPADDDGWGETLEEALERIDREWGDWLDD